MVAGLYGSPWLLLVEFYLLTRMWANAQPDGHPAEHRWHPLFNAAVWLTLTT